MGGRKKGAAVVLATALAAVVLVGFTTTSNGKSGTSSRGELVVRRELAKSREMSESVRAGRLELRRPCGHQDLNSIKGIHSRRM